MQASIFIFNPKPSPSLRSRLQALIVLFAVYLCPLFASAETSPAPEGQSEPSSQSLPAEEEDFSTTPYTEYGEFNEEGEEAADTLFFQHGRFFGVGIGSGVSGVTGNRGILWQGGFPIVDFKLHYWFDFNFAMDIGFFTTSHFYEYDISSTQSEHVDVNLINVGLGVKYYIDTKNLSSAISFANPFLSIGAGILYKTETSKTQGGSDSDSAFNVNIGGGLEFPVKHRQVYFALDGRLRYGNFEDTYSNNFSRTLGIEDLTGYFYTFTGAFVFTW